ncbi:Endoribonuclease ysh1 [Wickerhamomyces ciferrii]|uniref:Endoribonuclease ysh1 n=1 Tax=Wickerhamomyces ciferrii (strain ATCC 14091 / BCRC 22168 / CBS 111 / JCM 3599 / NBRC 0793 / NRRL Y-1031 F-60-10) TaxID=1206466 RepID=K0KMY0_WICCF|nr:Endoribonuclease ysh1 [Wickerhamomyces ciferrii]CCH44306.1 Endoribonuclease ysh1 [Wickerhamomyces ciferrii]
MGLFMNLKVLELVKLYLLTHAHADHLKGLDSSFSGHPVYCSEITKELLKLNPKYSRSWPSLRPLKENQRHTVPLKDGVSINLTLIPARHCPGAVMFLVESNEKSILITGDIRAERDWVGSLPRNEFLFPYTTSLKKFDNIYLDTTFGYRQEPFIDMKSNYFGLQALCEVMKFYPMDDDTFSFHFADSTIGYEEAWIRIISLFGGKMHSNNDLYKRLELLSNSNEYEYKDRIGKIKSLDPKSKFHCCGIRPSQCSGHISKFPVRLKHSIDISYEDMLNITHPLPWSQFSDVAIFQEELPQGHKIYKIDDIPHLLPNGKDYLLRNEIRFFFSRHSSYEECRHFISLFNVDDVYPLTESPKSWARGFQMKRQFGDLLNKSGDLIYDLHSTAVYGPAPTGLNTPQRIDKFSESFLRSVTDGSRDVAQPSGEFEFRGIAGVHNAAFRQSFTDEEMQFMGQYSHLVREGRHLAGVNQYRVERGIRALGPQYLNRYRDRDHEEHRIDTQDGSDDSDEDDLESAMRKFNRTRSNLNSRRGSFNNNDDDEDHDDDLPGTGVNSNNTVSSSTRVLVPSPPKREPLTEKSVDNTQNQQNGPKRQRTAKTEAPLQVINLDTQQESVVQLEPPVDLESQKAKSSNQLAPKNEPNETTLEAPTRSFLVRRISESPLKSSYERQITDINLENVSRIEQSIVNADGQGFFEYQLKSCKKK